MAFQKLELSTKEEWLAMRLKVLTASDISAILGLKKYSSVKLMENGKLESFEGNAWTQLGVWLEPIVVQMTNLALNKEFKLYEQEEGVKTFFVDLDLGFGATPDACTDDELLECKTCKPGAWLEYAYMPPLYYICQLYSQLIATNKQIGYLAIADTDLSQSSMELKLRLHVFKISRNVIVDSIFIEELKRYWKCKADNKDFKVDRQLSLRLKQIFRVSSEVVSKCR